MTERHPREIAIRAPARDRGKQKAHNRYGQHHRRESVEQDSELHEEAAPGKRSLSRTGQSQAYSSFLFLQVFRITVLRIIRSGIRLTGTLHAARCQPGNHICDFLV